MVVVIKQSDTPGQIKKKLNKIFDKKKGRAEKAF